MNDPIAYVLSPGVADWSRRSWPASNVFRRFLRLFWNCSRPP